MSPSNIENAIVTSSPLIGAVMVVGDGKPYNVALITPRPRRGRRLRHAERTGCSSLEALVGDARVRAAVQAGVVFGNASTEPC